MADPTRSVASLSIWQFDAFMEAVLERVRVEGAPAFILIETPDDLAERYPDLYDAALAGRITARGYGDATGDATAEE